MGFVMQVDFHPDATAELSESTEWYAAQSPTAARNFLVAVDLRLLQLLPIQRGLCTLTTDISLAAFPNSLFKLFTDMCPTGSK